MLSIIIPCYNEASNIPHLIHACKKAIPPNFSGEILLVDNGSTDDTLAVIKRYIESERLFRVIEIIENRGYGYGILMGLQAAKGRVLAWTHADCQTDPQDVFRAYATYLAYEDPKLVIKGHRVGRRYSAWFFSTMMQIIASICLQTQLSDINAQPKLCSRYFYETYIQAAAPHDFSLDLYFLLQAKRHGHIRTIPVSFYDRTRGEAKGGGSLHTRIRLIYRTLCYIAQLTRTL